MPISTWIRDLFGIRKDVVDTKKAKLEITKLEAEERERLITPAAMSDIEKYDPAHRRLIEQITNELNGLILLYGIYPSEPMDDKERRRPRKRIVFLVVLLLVGLLIVGLVLLLLLVR